jgi:hypothetical protein
MSDSISVVNMVGLTFTFGFQYIDQRAIRQSSYAGSIEMNLRLTSPHGCSHAINNGEDRTHHDLRVGDCHNF